MSETCQKLAFTHPIVILKSGLKNNWVKKLDRVNRPLRHFINIRKMKEDNISQLGDYEAPFCEQQYRHGSCYISLFKFKSSD